MLQLFYLTVLVLRKQVQFNIFCFGVVCKNANLDKFQHKSNHMSGGLCESLLHKQQLRKMNSIVVHDGLRNEMSSQHHQDQDMRDVLEQHEFDMSSLNIVINSREKHMINLRKCHEKSIQHRNERLLIARFHIFCHIFALNEFLCTNN